LTSRFAGWQIVHGEIVDSGVTVQGRICSGVSKFNKLNFMDILNSLLIILSCLLAIPTLVFAAQVFLASGTVESLIQQSRRPRVAVLVPAHNEAQVISTTLEGIVSCLGEDDSLLVVADNCTDKTAAIARDCGAVVIERMDEKRRGKGYALDFGIQFLAKNEPPEVVVIIDADCQITPRCIDLIACQAQSEHRPVQALYLMLAPANKSVSQAIAEFAWQVKNQVRPLAMLRLGLPCQLMGTGMAFPWELLRQANLAHGNMVEDMKLGIDLALNGFPPMFCPGALVTSEFPTSEKVTGKQRERWEHGHLATILAESPRLLKAALQRRDFNLLAMALDLAVPPLSVLGLSLSLILGMSFLASLLTDNMASLWGMIILNGIFIASFFVAWYRFGRNILSFQALCGVPVYILRKIPLYAAFLIKRQQDWVKTDRQ
jgi:cellulose synthase/poly-beta-1,6-N-acetylglucosamine synthase-like glycosyltransferase